MRPPGPSGGTWSFERITGRGGWTARTVALHEFDPGSVRASRARPALDSRAGFRLPPVPWRRASGYRSRGGWTGFAQATNADDAVMTFEDEQDGRRVLAVLGRRLARFGLTLHETKTQYVDFRPKLGRGHDLDATFDFLGFNHVWTRSRRGHPVVRQFTARDRFARAVKTVHRWCKTHRHEPLATQQDHLARVIRGHCNYYGRIGNSARLTRFR